MKQMILALAGLTLAVCSGHAQVTIDVTKITCEKFRNYKMKTSDNIAIWLSGYYLGTQNETVELLLRWRIVLIRSRVRRQGQSRLPRLKKWLRSSSSWMSFSATD